MRVRTHHTPPYVLDGLVDVHPRPVVQHVADAGGAVDEPHVVLTSLRHCVETVNKINTPTHFSVQFPEGQPKVQCLAQGHWKPLLTLKERLRQGRKTRRKFSCTRIKQSIKITTSPLFRTWKSQVQPLRHDSTKLSSWRRLVGFSGAWTHLPSSSCSAFKPVRQARLLTRLRSSPSNSREARPV